MFLKTISFAILTVPQVALYIYIQFGPKSNNNRATLETKKLK